MKRKILSLVLCALMLVSAFLVGCGEKTEDEIIARIAKNATQPYTITLWIPTNDSTTAEAVQAVEDAMNEILRKEFSTEVKIYASKDSEYEAAVEARLNEIKGKIDGGAEAAKLIMDDKVKNGDVTVIKTEAGTYETVYPDVLDTQMDIFLTRTKADFDKYKSAGQLASLYNHLTGLYRNFDKIIATNLLRNGETYWHERYGVPVNHVIGEYSFLVVDKTLADKYNATLKAEDKIDFASLTTLADLEAFITWAKGQTSVALAGAKDVFTAEDQTVWQTLSDAGCVGTSDDAAVFYAKGDFVDLENYRKDSYVVKYEMPVATEEEIFSSVFVISSYSVENPTTNPRAMDFLYYLNTDVTMKTLLQYGIEGVHYELVYAEDDINLENPTIRIISDDYSMNTLYTGNIYKTYRAEGVTLADSWETAKEQNLDSVIK